MDLLSRARSLKTLFNPQSVAIIGASDNPLRIGGRPIKYSLDAGYSGRIYPINPKYQQVQGLKAYPDLQSLPEQVDLCIIAIPGKYVVDTLEQCAAAGVKSVIIFSAGFAEVGGEGEKEQQRIRELAERYEINVLGPNCLGVLSYDSGLMASFTSTLEAGNVERGSIGFACQSGAFGTYFLALARARGMTFSQWVATGNEAVISTADCIAYMALDPATRVIAGYVEGVQDGQRFIEALELARQNRKPVVMFKAGRSAIGSRAAVSHTASMTGNDAVFDAVFERYGVHRAKDVHEMLNVIEACAYEALPRGNRLCLVTVSGGVGVMMADRASEIGVELPPIPEEVQAAMKERLPYAGVMNPVDVTAQVMNELDLLETFTDAIVKTGCYDAVLTFMGHAIQAPSVADEVVPAYMRIAENAGIPFFLSGITTPEYERELHRRGLQILDNPVQAVDTIHALVKLRQSLEKAGEPSHHPPALLVPDAQAMVSRLLAVNDGIPESQKVLSESAGRELLRMIGIPFPRGGIATTVDEAVALAAELGYPVVLKIDSDAISHKSDIGGVRVGIENEAELRRAYDEILNNVRRYQPGTRINGVLVVEMAGDGVEVIVGLQRDPMFGPVVMFGMGGIYAEVFQDRQLALCPITPEQAQELILRTRIGRILRGVRGQDPYDIDALAELISVLSRWAIAEPRVAEVDLNPVRVGRRGSGVSALDALVVLRPEGGNRSEDRD